MHVRAGVQQPLAKHPSDCEVRRSRATTSSPNRACPKGRFAESLSASFVGTLCRNAPFSTELRESVSTRIATKLGMSLLRQALNTHHEWIMPGRRRFPFAVVCDGNGDAKTSAAFELCFQPSLRRAGWGSEQAAGPHPSQARDCARDQTGRSRSLGQAKTDA